MDHIQWDSEVYDAYIVSLNKLYLRLETQSMRLTAAWQDILRQNEGGEDETLQKAALRLKAAISRVDGETQRVRRLRDALAAAPEAFLAAERRISQMGMELLYTQVMRQTPVSNFQPRYTVYSSPFLTRSVTPPWLSALAQKHSGRSDA